MLLLNTYARRAEKAHFECQVRRTLERRHDSPAPGMICSISIAYPALVKKEQLQILTVTSQRSDVCEAMHEPLWILSDIAVLRTERLLTTSEEKYENWLSSMT